MKRILLILPLLSSFFMNAQGENNNWYFGIGMGLNFASNPPTLLSGGAMATYEGVATISNPAGDLLFYTDGVTVWNRQHTAMPNGNGLLGHNDSQQVVILPYPGNNNLYYIFTCAPVGVNGGAASFSHSAYTLVDMSLGAIGTNGLPLGDVVLSEKNIELLDANGNPFSLMSESIAATLHADGISYWVLFASSGNLCSYRLDSAGFHNLPVASPLPAPLDPLQTQMHLRVSPKFDNLPYSNLISLSRWPGGLSFAVPNYGIRVFSFDDVTGLITPDYLMNINNSYGYTTEFSSDGRLLFSAELYGHETRVIDLFNGVSRLILPWDQYMRAGAIQRAVNGEIYIALQAESNTALGYEHLGKINNQNSYSTCSIQRDGQFIDTSTMGSGNSGLPPLVPLLSSPNDTCYEHLVFGFPEANSIVHQAGSTITTNNVYKVDSGLTVSLKAGDMVNMQTGTYIVPGSNFVAQIEDCTSTGLRKAKITAEPMRFVINKTMEEQAIIAYPNPATDKLTVQVTGHNIISIEVYTVDGRNIASHKTDGDTYQLDVAAYQKGVYMVLITTQDNQTHIVRIVKE